MDLIEKSLEIALKAYKGQKDKAGETYILHPLRLMAKVTSVEEKSVALLHDVIEDSEFTAEDLLSEGIPSEIVFAVQAMTKADGENYEAFILRVKDNPLAARIKCLDIEDNINVLRLNAISQKDLDRVAKYHKAWSVLQK